MSMKDLYPMHKICAALLSGMLDSIQPIAELRTTESLWDDVEAADQAVQTAIDCGWTGRGMDKLLASKAGRYWSVLETISRHADELGMTKEQATLILNKCRSNNGRDKWDCLARSILFVLAETGPVQAEAKKALSEHKTEWDNFHLS